MTKLNLFDVLVQDPRLHDLHITVSVVAMHLSVAKKWKKKKKIFMWNCVHALLEDLLNDYQWHFGEKHLNGKLETKRQKETIISSRRGILKNQTDQC